MTSVGRIFLLLAKVLRRETKKRGPASVAMLDRCGGPARLSANERLFYLCPRGRRWAGNSRGKSIMRLLAYCEANVMPTRKPASATRLHENFTAAVCARERQRRPWIKSGGTGS